MTDGAQLQIAMAFDDHYLWPWFVACHALRANSEQTMLMNIGFDPESLSEDSQRACNAVGEYLEMPIKWIPCSTGAFPENGHLSRTAFAKLVLADQMHDTYLWLDADTLPLPGWDDLLLNLSSEAAAVSGVIDLVAQRTMRTTNAAKAAAGTRYVNTGVLLIDAQRWANLDLPRIWRTAAASYEDLGFEWSDQCVLNFSLAGQVHLLPSEYNFVPSSSEPDHRPPRIVHFAGNRKPWAIPIDERWRVRLSAKRRRDQWSHWAALYFEYEGAALEGLERSSALASSLRACRTRAQTGRRSRVSSLVGRLYR